MTHQLVVREVSLEIGEDLHPVHGPENGIVVIGVTLIPQALTGSHIPKSKGERQPSIQNIVSTNPVRTHAIVP